MADFESYITTTQKRVIEYVYEEDVAFDWMHVSFITMFNFKTRIFFTNGIPLDVEGSVTHWLKKWKAAL